MRTFKLFPILLIFGTFSACMTLPVEEVSSSPKALGNPSTFPTATPKLTPSPTPKSSIPPTPLPPVSAITKVGTGEYEVFFLAAGKIHSYGFNTRPLALGPYAPMAIPARRARFPENLDFVDLQGGLHQSIAVDENGYVWTWGDTGIGLSGNGTVSGSDPSIPYQILVDADGAVFKDIASVYAFKKFNAAVKKDGSVYVWGDCAGGLLANGTSENGILTRPTKVQLPPGLKVKKISGYSSHLHALDVDGNVWGWGQGESLATIGTGNANRYHAQKLPNLPKIVDIAEGAGSFALGDDGQIYGWGQRSDYLGISPSVPIPTPRALNSILGFTKRVVVIAANTVTSHAILEDGSLWSWGNSIMGGAGNGTVADWPNMPTPYAWDFEATIWIHKAVRNAPQVSNFTKIFTNSPYVFYTYAQTADGKLYCWGRNKGAVLSNGVYASAPNGNSGTASAFTALYPDSWNVNVPTLVDPFRVDPKPVVSPICTLQPGLDLCQR